MKNLVKVIGKERWWMYRLCWSEGGGVLLGFVVGWGERVGIGACGLSVSLTCSLLFFPLGRQVFVA